MVGERMREVMKSADKESSESEEDRGCGARAGLGITRGARSGDRGTFATMQ